ncbi:hypothetical protein BU16DRAFT_36125 [Lophium mytilinum]|uniref:Uncharacterized protein n=1 Tax=Lophium mytilinum TaxID=390894 RepID=A0A6A6RFF2_9PEZI|nr:hypothetical protein BU16DRAFT_36125 [Lophium mytilinum]
MIWTNMCEQPTSWYVDEWTSGHSPIWNHEPLRTSAKVGIHQPYQHLRLLIDSFTVVRYPSAHGKELPPDVKSLRMLPIFLARNLHYPSRPALNILSPALEVLLRNSDSISIFQARRLCPPSPTSTSCSLTAVRSSSSTLKPTRSNSTLSNAQPARPPLPQSNRIPYPKTAWSRDPTGPRDRRSLINPSYAKISFFLVRRTAPDAHGRARQSRERETEHWDCWDVQGRFRAGHGRNYSGASRTSMHADTHNVGRGKRKKRVS